MMAFNLNDYEPVEVRLARFWAEHPNGRVLTELIHHGDGQFIVRTALFREGDNQPFATGYAEELVSTRGVNQTSALENCETSSTGRALANAGYAPKGKRPSLEEMQKVVRAGGKPATPELTDLQKSVREELLKFHPESSDRKAYLESKTGRVLAGLAELSEAECTSILDDLKAKETANG